MAQDLFQKLRPCSFRGIPFPITNRQFGFAHDYARHKFIFRDEELIEGLGRRSSTWSYEVPVRQGIVRGPYRDLFSKGLAELLRACLDRTVGALVDPVYGEFPAVCASWSERLDPNKRDGVDVTLEFIHAPPADEGFEVEGVFGIGAAKSEAGALDKLVTGTLPITLETPIFLNPIAQIEGLLKALELQGGAIAAKIDGFAGSIDSLNETIDEFGDPAAWPIKNSAAKLKDTVLGVKETLTSAANVFEHTTKAITTISAVAADLGTTAQELMTMNPGLVETCPDVMAGTVVKYTKKANAQATGKAAA